MNVYQAQNFHPKEEMTFCSTIWERTCLCIVIHSTHHLLVWLARFCPIFSFSSRSQQVRLHVRIKVDGTAVQSYHSTEHSQNLRVIARFE